MKDRTTKRTPKSAPAARPAKLESWTQDTPRVQYTLEMEPFDEGDAQYMPLTREEFLDLKIRLCELRGIEPGERLTLERSCARTEREAKGFKTTGILLPLGV